MLSFDSSGDLYIADQSNNRVVEVAVSAHSQWGTTMAANDIYTVAGTGASGLGADSVAATSSALSEPSEAAVGPDGNLYISDSANNRVQVVAAASGSYWGHPGSSVTANYVYTVAGSASGTEGTNGDQGAAGSSYLYFPAGLAFSSSGNLYVADYSNSRVQEVALANGTYFGQAMNADDIYTIAGSSSGSWGYSGNGGLATSAQLAGAMGVASVPSGALYIADYGNDRVAVVPSTSGTYWGQSMSANDIYNVAGPGSASTANDSAQATDSGIDGPAGVVADASGNVYFTDQWDNRVQEIAATTHYQWGWSTPLVAGDVYTIAGSPTGKYGDSGDNGAPPKCSSTSPGAWPSTPSGTSTSPTTGTSRSKR